MRSLARKVAQIALVCLSAAPFVWLAPGVIDAVHAKARAHRSSPTHHISSPARPAQVAPVDGQPIHIPNTKR